MSSLPTNPLESLKRRNPHLYGRPAPEDATNDESHLQEGIISECRRRGWWVDYSRMDLPTTRPRGAPDLYVFASDGRFFAIECKSKNGKLTAEQLGVSLMLEKLGHKVHLIRSFREFLDLITIETSMEFHELSQMAKDGVIK